MASLSQVPTSPSAPLFQNMVRSLNYKAVNEELNRVTAVFNPGNPYEIKAVLMRYDTNFNQDFLDQYSANYGGRWARGPERLELGMTAEESYTHWDNTMNFALKNGAVVILLWRLKGTDDEWKFGVGSHCFDMADMTLPDYKTLHPPSYQPWADVFDKLFVDYYKQGELVHGRYFWNNSTCRVDELKIKAMNVMAHFYAIVCSEINMIGGHVIVLSAKLQDKIYDPVKKQSNAVRVVEFTEVYDCKPEQKALMSIQATNIYFNFDEMNALRKKVLGAYAKMNKRSNAARL